MTITHAALILFATLATVSVVLADATPVLPTGRQVRRETVPAAGHSFTIRVAGNTDPVMRRLEMVGPVVDPKIVCDRWIDPETPATVLKSILKPGMSEKEKAMAIFWWCQENCSRCTPWIWDDARFASALGFGHCGPTGYAQSALCNAAGLQWQPLRLWGHNCIQIWYEDRWHILDAYMRAIYPGPTGLYAASAAELAKDERLITRNVGEDGREMKELIDINYLKKWYVAFDGGGPFEMGRKFPWDENRISYSLRAGERMIFWWDRRVVCSYKQQETPGNFTNPQLIYEPDLASSEAKEGVKSMSNVSWGTSPLPLTVAEAGKPAEVIWEISSYYNLMAGWIEGNFSRGGRGDVLRISVSADGGKVWTPVWEHSETGAVQARIDLAGKLPFTPKEYSKGLRGYLARVEMHASGDPSQVGIGSIRFHTELLGHNQALPALRLGNNTITVTATSAPRPFTVTYEYDEVQSLAADNYEPVEGMPVKLTATVKNTGDAPAENIRVQFYDGDPAGLGKPMGDPVTIASLPRGGTATAMFTWTAVATGDRGTFYHGTPEKPFYYHHTDVFAAVNPDGQRPTSEQTATWRHFQLFVHQKPKLLITEPFILFIEEEKTPGQVRIRATVRNSCQWEKWLYTRGTTVRDVTLRFFDGDPDNGGRQIGADQILPVLDPVGFASADVLWDVYALNPGRHRVWVVVDPDRRITVRDMNVSNRASREYEVNRRK